jgi:hypothetical protein
MLTYDDAVRTILDNVRRLETRYRFCPWNAAAIDSWFDHRATRWIIAPNCLTEA